MSRIEKIISRMKNNPRGISFADLCIVCDHLFGAPRQKGTSHRVYEKPWKGDPRINIQSSQGMAKPYQVKQVMKAIERLKQHEQENQ